MDRAEATGLGVATAGHCALLAALAFGFANARLLEIRNEAIEVAFVEEAALQSSAPIPSAGEPAPRLSEPEPVSQLEPLAEPAPAPAPPPIVPQPRLVPPPPRPAPKAIERPPPPRQAATQPKQAQPKQAQPKQAQPKQAQPKQAQPKQVARPKQAAPSRDRLAGLLDGVTERPSEGKATSAPAAVAGPAVKASLGAEVQRQLKPHWRAPTGADVDQLRTTIQVRLGRDGSLAGEPRVLRQTGVTASNRTQAELHAERAIRAVKLAAPFNLPAEYYDAWKVISPIFDKRLG